MCRALVEQGHQVRAFHRAASPLTLLDGLPVEHALGDLTAPETLRLAMAGIEVCFHAAALLGAQQDASRLQAVTVAGTRAVLAAAREAGVRRVVHTSSAAALGAPEVGPVSPERLDAIPCMNENHTWNLSPAAYPYGYAKYLAELEVQKAVAQGLDVVIVNPTGVFGARDVHRQSRSLVVQAARGGIPVSIPGGWNVVHIEDVTAGHLAALERGRTGERYLLGGENLTFTRFLQMLADVTGAPPPRGTLPMWVVRTLGVAARAGRAFIRLPVDVTLIALAGRYFFYDLAKAQNELGLPQPRPAHEALADAHAWFEGRKAGRV